ncbi:unnamed protein product [Staurois parvus]|uniref:Uncharacterized protein n=1 Tax=Staurois parvus TaxID=386267 RepID=A0ABN9CGU0_9NEOB|nr:unnamed protein product [Staurois parvus]
MYIHAQRHMYTHTHMYTHINMYRYTHVHTHKHTNPIKSCSTSLFTHRALHSRGRQRAQHILLPLLSLHPAIEQSDGSQ